MATYKLMQDIEAEDKILGPLTLRQFIFGLVTAFFIYLCVFAVTKGVAWLLFVFAPPAIFCGFFAFPFGRDQPTEIWFLAKLRFWFLPRERVWNQSGVKELVTITVPKKVERVLTDGLSQSEVKSRLSALANTIDSRGWAIKNVSAYAQPAMAMNAGDRLIDLDSLPQDVPDANDADDVMDPAHSQLAQQMDSMVAQSAQIHHQQLVSQMNSSEQPAAGGSGSSTGWFMDKSHRAIVQTPSVQSLPSSATPVMPALNTADEAALSQQLKKRTGSQDVAYGHMRTVRPLGSAPVPPPVQQAPVTPAPAVTTPSDPAILQLAGNDDLDVATLARQAHKAKGDDDRPSTDEVVISLR